MPSPADTTATRPERWDWTLSRLNALIAQRRPRCVLVLCRNSDRLSLEVVDGMLLVVGGLVAEGSDARLRCRVEALPFSSRSFDLVIVQGWVTDGRDPGFEELLRVLDGGGHLVVLGPGPCCQRALRGDLPPVRPSRLGRALRARDFIIEQKLGHGIIGRPVTTGEGWRRPLFALSDAVLLAARHQGHDPVVRPLRFARPRAVGVRPAVLDGLNREAAA